MEYSVAELKLELTRSQERTRVLEEQLRVKRMRPSKLAGKKIQARGETD